MPFKALTRGSGVSFARWAAHIMMWQSDVMPCYASLVGRQRTSLAFRYVATLEGSRREAALRKNATRAG
eukprot:11201077-Lingulodinium_polyedra.AAC.1